MFNPLFRRSAVLRALLEKFLEYGENGGFPRPGRPVGAAAPGKAGALEDNPEEGGYDGEKGFPRTIDA
jgi:hypothetical protein